MNWMNINVNAKLSNGNFFSVFLNILNEQIANFVTELVNESVGWKRK